MNYPGMGEMLAELEKLRAFKKYVHDRLDMAGVPTDPNGPHQRQGCRIGDRLDELIGDRDRGGKAVAASELLLWHFPDLADLVRPSDKAEEVIEAARSAVAKSS